MTMNPNMKWTLGRSRGSVLDRVLIGFWMGSILVRRLSMYP